MQRRRVIHSHPDPDCEADEESEEGEDVSANEESPNQSGDRPTQRGGAEVPTITKSGDRPPQRVGAEVPTTSQHQSEDWPTQAATAATRIGAEFPTLTRFTQTNIMLPDFNTHEGRSNKKGNYVT